MVKVSFFAYLVSLVGFRGSSRYFSIEIFKDEDLWVGRGFGGWGVYRFFSFGVGEGFLRF